VAAPFVLDVNLRIQDIIGLGKFKAALAKTGGSVGVGGDGGGVSKGKPTSGFPVGGAGFGQVGIPNNVATETVNNLNKVEAAAKDAGGTIKQTGETMGRAGVAAKGFGHSMTLALQRYSAFVAATTIPFALIAGFKNAAESVIEFDTAMTKMSQILDTSKGALQSIGQDMIKLSVDTGTSLKDITTAGKVLAQAGFLRGGADEFKAFLEPLAKVPLLASFEGIEQATEGVIAALNQFSTEGLTATDVLDKLDHVSNNYATTASDLVEGIKRGGGAFAALGGNLNEFIALFTTMRSVTRESASAIGTSIRTITARMARPRTTKFLEGLGVEIHDAEGELLGVIDILNNLNEVFTASGKEGKAAIAEQLGGFRQISRVLAAIQNPEKIQAALKSSQEASGSISKNAQKGLDSLSAQLNVMGAKWTEFIQKLGEPIFIPLIKGVTGFLTVVVKVLDTMGPLIPLFAKLIGFAGGIALLAASLKLIPAALNLTSKAFAGAGLMSGLSGMVGLGGASGTAAKAAAGASFAGLYGVGGGDTKQTGGQKLVGLSKGQIPQLIAATGLYAALGGLSKSAQEAGHSTTALALETTKTITAMAIAASLLSGKSLGALASGAKGALTGAGGAGLAGGLTAAGGIGVAGLGALGLAASAQADINIDQLVKKAADYVNKLNIKVTDEKTLTRAGGEIGKKFASTIQNVGKEYDGFVGGIAQFGQRLGSFGKTFFSFVGLAEADWEGIAGDLIDKEKVGEIFDKMIEGSPQTFKDMLDTAINESGPDFGKALEDALGSLAGGNLTPVARKLGRDKIVEASGGEAAALGKVLKGLEVKEKTEFVEESKRLATDLAKIVIPSQISTELDQFQYAIHALTTEVNASTGTFNNLAGNIGTVTAAQLPTDFSEEGVRKQLETPGGFEELMSNFSKNAGDFADLREAGAVLAKAKSGIETLLQSLTAAEAAAQTQTDLSNVLQNVSKIGNEAALLFGESLAGVAPEMKAPMIQLFKGVTDEWNQSMKDGVRPDPKIINNMLEDMFKVLGSSSEGLIKGIQTGLISQTQLINSQINAEVKKIQIDLTHMKSAESQFQHFNQLLRETGQAPVGDFGVPEDAARQGDFNNRMLDTVDRIGKASEARATAEKDFRLAKETGIGDSGEASKRFMESNLEIARLNALIQQGLGLIQKAEQNLSNVPGLKENPRALESERKYLSDLSEKISLLSQQAELKGVVDASGIMREASTTFDKAVTKFNDSIVDLVRSLKPEEVPSSQGEGDFRTINGKLVPLNEKVPEEKAAKEQQLFGTDATRAAETYRQELAKQETMYQGLIRSVTSFNNGLITIGGTIAGFFTGKKVQAEDLQTYPGPTEEQKKQAAKNLGESAVEQGLTFNTAENVAKAYEDLGRVGAEAAIRIGKLSSVSELAIAIAEKRAQIKGEFTTETPGADITSGAAITYPIDIQQAIDKAYQKLDQQQQMDMQSQDINPTLAVPSEMDSFVPITDAATKIGDSITQLIPVADTIGQTMIAFTDIMAQSQQAPVQPEDVGGTGQQTDQMAESINNLSAQIETVRDAVDRQTEQQASITEDTPEDRQPVVVEGLAENTEAVTSSSTSTREGMIALGAEMGSMATAMKDGVPIDVQTMSKVVVDVKGVADASKEFTKDFELVSTQMAKAEIRVVLKRLASASGNPELAKVFESVTV
jgi:TP901 family phage tail tape measure protein